MGQTMESIEAKQYLSFWTDEQNSAVLYQTLAQVEKDARLAEIYTRMAKVEIKHASQWEEQLKSIDCPLPVYKPDLRTRLMIWLARRFGPSMVLPNMQAMEQKGTKAYRQAEKNNGMAVEETSHARLINIITRSIGGGMEGGSLAVLEGRHRATGGNALRAAVLGANDGLCSNLSLVMGVAGAQLASKSILVTGLAGLLAGACSMALGEWLSVQSARELFTNQISIEKDEIEAHPEEEAEELALIYEARGLQPDQAHLLADQIISNPQSAIDTLAREELGVDPKELGGSAWEAAITSFLLFALGAVIPTISFMFLTGTTAVLVSIGMSTIGLFLVGSITSLFTAKGVLFSGLRMVIFGLVAACVTFGIGRLIGVAIG
jgi:vacuolar iron transporter family protein